MADNIDLNFLGEQMARLQSDVRTVKGDIVQIRAEQARTDADLQGLRSDLGELRFDVRNLEASINARFEQMQQSFATTTEVLLTAINGLKR